MIKKITGVMVILMLLCMGLTQAQTNRRIAKEKVATLSGNEVGNPNGHVVDMYSNIKLFPTRVLSGDLNFNFVPTNIPTGYNSQSNGVPQEIWVNTENKTDVHALVIWSNQTAAWTDRTVKYLYSFDAGVTWDSVGHVPPSGNRSGYPAIDGYMSDGSALVTDHSFDADPTTRTLVFKDDGAGAGTFSTEYDPGYSPVWGSGHPNIWPRLAVIDDNNFAVAASENTGGADSMFVDLYNSTTGFGGWKSFPGDQAESYSLAVSEDSTTLGLLYAGNTPTVGDVFYTQTTDLGASWSDPIRVWQTYLDTVIASTGDSVFMGVLRGLDLVFIGDAPCATFEVGGIHGTSLYPDWPSMIYFWKPDVNGGQSFAIADTNNVPFFDHFYYSNPAGIEALVPICRPTIGRSQRGNYLFVAFNATTPNFYGDTSTVAETYWAGYFAMSTDSGFTWSTPTQFTEDMMNGHLQDYRYISIAPVNPVTDSTCTVQMLVQVDSIPSNQVIGLPPGFPATYAMMYNVNVDVTVPIPTGVREQPKNSPYTFTLQQNYPNPFNPSTKIRYSVATRSDVNLKIYDMLGREVATLVNTVKEPGNYTINFNASKLASGMYIYKLTAGKFTSAKKMVLLK